MSTRDIEVVVVGAGFGGLGAAIKLREAGIDDVVVLEREAELGGTWWANTYPGCACDVPSHLYSFSFAPNPDWSRFFPSQPEILAYLQRLADDHDVRRLVRFGCELLEARWDDDARRWIVRTSAGDELRARVLISAAGTLSEPCLPDVPGLDRFDGPVVHSARWDHDVELRGRRVACIGTGASAAQFLPHVQAQAARVSVFQRTPPWVLPRIDFEHPGWMRKAMKRVPALQRALRTSVYYGAESLIYGLTKDQRALLPTQTMARLHLRRNVKDRALRKRLTPSYKIGCKRIIFANDYHRALAEPNVEVVTDGVTAVEPGGVRTADGRLHEADVLLLGTGFKVFGNPVAARVFGREGRSLAEVWADAGPVAYRGVAVHGFPNQFLLIGPNTGLGNNSMINVIEAQLVWVLDALRGLRERDAAALDVRADAQDAWNLWVQEQLAGTVWNQGGCRSWYLTEDGTNRVLWPTYSDRFKRSLSSVKWEDVDVLPATERQLVASRDV